jgi:adenine phosphoribosyltransferase
MDVDYRGMIRTIPDFPMPGVQYRDITPLLSDADSFRSAILALAEPFRLSQIDRVVAIEARGYLLGAPIAFELGAGFVPVRKVGKLPFHTYRAEYALEYGEATIEMHRDGLLEHHRVLIVDDVLATGGTMSAAINLVEQSGAIVVGITTLIELPDLHGREVIADYNPITLINF